MVLYPASRSLERYQVRSVTEIVKVDLAANGRLVTVKRTDTRFPGFRARTVKPSTLQVPSQKVTLVTKTDLEPRVLRRSLGPNGHWDFPAECEPMAYFGFIYLIHDTRLDKFYIGKKQYRLARGDNVNQESDWKIYRSSCKPLRHQIKLRGKGEFKFYILDQYRTRGSLAYAESWSLMQVEAPANHDRWYNYAVNEVNWHCYEQITQRHKQRLAAIMGGG